MVKKARFRVFYLVVPAILLFFFLALDSMVDDSPTMDEQNHIARGLALLRTGDPRLSLEHPPLVNVISALPLLSVNDIRLPIDHPSWDQPEGWYAFAEQFLWAYNNDVTKIVFLGRLPIVFLTLTLALAGFHFGRELWGWPASIAAFLFLLFDPNILSHGRYSTTDIGGAAFLLIAAYLLWRLWIFPGWLSGKILIAGLGLGLAFGSKLSNLVFAPIFLLMSVLPLYDLRGRWHDSGRRLAQFLLAGLFSVIILWVIFAFQWGPFTFQSNSLQFLNHFSGPMPTFWSGIEQIFNISGGGRASYLLGEFSDEGWWYYFPVAFLVKTPIIVIILFLFATIFLLATKDTRKKTAFLLIPTIVFFLISIQSTLNIGYRHLLPILPFIYLLIAGLVKIPLLQKPILRKKVTLGSFFLITSLLIVISSDLLLHPHYLSYFNFLSGGSEKGGEILIDSNIDWGQDLIRLKEWMDKEDVVNINLAWFGSADPSYYGINYNPLPGLPRHFDLWWDPPFDTEQPEPGIYAISVSNLGELPLTDKVVFKWFREHAPDEKIGYSINIYYVGQDN